MIAYTEDEYKEIVDNLKNMILNDLNELTESWKDKYTKEEKPEDYFHDFIEQLRIFKKDFDYSQSVISKIDEAISEIKEYIECLEYNDPEWDNSDFFNESNRMSEVSNNSSRVSIFDDVDE